MNYNGIKKSLNDLRTMFMEDAHDMFAEYLSVEPSQEHDTNLREILEAYRLIVQSCETIASQIDIIEDLSEG